MGLFSNRKKKLLYGDIRQELANSKYPDEVLVRYLNAVEEEIVKTKPAAAAAAVNFEKARRQLTQLEQEKEKLEMYIQKCSSNGDLEGEHVFRGKLEILSQKIDYTKENYDSLEEEAIHLQALQEELNNDQENLYTLRERLWENNDASQLPEDHPLKQAMDENIE